MGNLPHGKKLLAILGSPGDQNKENLEKFSLFRSAPLFTVTVFWEDVNPTHKVRFEPILRSCHIASPGIFFSQEIAGNDIRGMKKLINKFNFCGFSEVVRNISWRKFGIRCLCARENVSVILQPM